jgi:hypothetical protein
MQIRYTPGVDSTVDAYMRLQDWLPNADRRFGLDGLVFGGGLRGAALRLSVRGARELVHENNPYQWICRREMPTDFNSSCALTLRGL